MANITPDLTRWNILVSNQNYEALISDADQFWITFCMARLSIPSESSFVEKEGNILNYSVTAGVCNQLKVLVENIRKMFIQTIYSQKNCFIETKKVQSGITYLEDYFDLISHNMEICGLAIEYNFYASNIKPIWPKLAEYLGADFAEGSSDKLIPEQDVYERIEELKFLWKWKKQSQSAL